MEWQNDWHGKIKFSHGTSNSKGVAILILSELDIDISETKKDADGRFLMLDFLITESRYIIANLYTPIIDKRKELVIFRKYVLNQLENYVGKNDFNIDIDINKSYSEPSKDLGYGKTISSMMATLDVVDIWKTP